MEQEKVIIENDEDREALQFARDNLALKGRVTGPLALEQTVQKPSAFYHPVRLPLDIATPDYHIHTSL